MQTSRQQDLAGNLATDIKVKVGDKELEVHQLRIEDFCAAEEYIRNQRLDAFLKQTRMVNLPDAVRAKTMAEILNRPVSLDEILSNVSGQVYLLYLSLKRGNPQITADYVRTQLEPTAIKTLSQILWVITGLVDELEEEKEPNPLEVRTFTTETKTSNGDGSS